MFDYATSLAMLDNDGQLLDELIQVFITEMPTRYENLQAALADRQADKIGKLAHSLKGSLGAIGALQVMQSAQALESAAKAENWHSIPLLAGQFDNEYQKLIAELRQLAN